jgi:hypothetical protein
MELNKLVFPTPPPSYTHELVNSGDIDRLEFFPSGVSKPLEPLAPKANFPGRMLYVPKFELFETGTALVMMNTKAAARRLAPSVRFGTESSRMALLKPSASNINMGAQVRNASMAAGMMVQPCITDAGDDYGPLGAQSPVPRRQRSINEVPLPARVP